MLGTYQSTEIKGNDEADAAAKEAAKGIPSLFALSYTDYYPVIREVINRQWQIQWTNSRDKLREVKVDTTPLSRRDQVCLARLRIGHTRFSHGHMMEGVGVPAPARHYCNHSVITVKHILTECPQLRNERLRFFHSRNPELRVILGNAERGVLFQFLTEIDIYGAI